MYHLLHSFPDSQPASSRSSVVRFVCLFMICFSVKFRIITGHVTHYECGIVLRYGSDYDRCPGCQHPLDWLDVMTVFWTIGDEEADVLCSAVSEWTLNNLTATHQRHCRLE